MKLIEFFALVESMQRRIPMYVWDTVEVRIPVKLPYATMGSSPSVSLQSVYRGFDWDSKSLFLVPEKELTPFKLKEKGVE